MSRLINVDDLDQFKREQDCIAKIPYVKGWNDCIDFVKLLGVNESAVVKGDNIRKILFRGKPKSKISYYEWAKIWPNSCKGGFVYGSLIVNENKCYICVSTISTMNCYINNSIVSVIEVFPNTVGQYTGLTAENGKKIFEGDILEFDRELMVVTFDNGSFQCKTDRDRVFSFSDKKALCYAKDTEIIGNIHDNPELLEV